MKLDCLFNFASIHVLFIAIIINNLETVKGEERAGADERAGDPAARLAALRAELEEIEAVLRRDRAP